MMFIKDDEAQRRQSRRPLLPTPCTGGSCRTLTFLHKVHRTLATYTAPDDAQTVGFTQVGSSPEAADSPPRKPASQLEAAGAYHLRARRRHPGNRRTTPMARLNKRYAPAWVTAPGGWAAQASSVRGTQIPPRPAT